MCVQVATVSRRGSLEAYIWSNCEHPLRVQQTKLGPPREQRMLFTTEPSPVFQ